MIKKKISWWQVKLKRSDLPVTLPSQPRPPPLPPPIPPPTSSHTEPVSVFLLQAPEQLVLPKPGVSNLTSCLCSAGKSQEWEEACVCVLFIFLCKPSWNVTFPLLSMHITKHSIFVVHMPLSPREITDVFRSHYACHLYSWLLQPCSSG